jgi:hypothetical protein
MANSAYTALYGSTRTDLEITTDLSGTSLVAAPGAGKRLFIHDIYINSTGADTINIKFTDSAGTAQDYQFELAAGGQVGRRELNAIVNTNAAITIDSNTSTAGSLTTNVLIDTGVITDPA